MHQDKGDSWTVYEHYATPFWLVADDDHKNPSAISRSHHAVCRKQTQGSNAVRARMAFYTA